MSQNSIPYEALTEWLYDLKWTAAAGTRRRSAKVSQALAAVPWIHQVLASSFTNSCCSSSFDHQDLQRHAFEKQANGETFIIRFAEGADYSRLLNELPLRPGGIIHLGNCDTGSAGPREL